jgi:hypothetical protein
MNNLDIVLALFTTLNHRFSRLDTTAALLHILHKENVCYFLFFINFSVLEKNISLVRMATVKDMSWKTYACILKAHSHSHSMSGSAIWASLECHCCFWIAGGLGCLPFTWKFRWFHTESKWKKRRDKKTRRLDYLLNLHSLSVSEL